MQAGRVSWEASSTMQKSKRFRINIGLKRERLERCLCCYIGLLVDSQASTNDDLGGCIVVLHFGYGLEGLIG